MFLLTMSNSMYTLDCIIKVSLGVDTLGLLSCYKRPGTREPNGGFQQVTLGTIQQGAGLGEYGSPSRGGHG